MSPAVGDVICTRGGGWAGRVIRFGAALLGRPNTVAHVAIMVGPGSDGRERVIEGRPGGVGYRDAADYLSSPWTLNNAGQPKTDAQRAAIAAAAVGLIGTPYDWVGIAADAMRAVHAPALYERAFRAGQASPDHLVCSSLADWVYAHVGLENPGRAEFDRTTTPADWAQLITEHDWNR